MEEKEGCEFCLEEKEMDNCDGSITVFIAEKKFYSGKRLIAVSHPYKQEIVISYCPMCGRKL